MRKLARAFMIVILLSFLLPNIPACAADFVNTLTLVEGHIIQNTNWTVAGSPYRLIGEVIVDHGVTLTIEPGAKVEFADNASLTVNGTLYAVGTSAAIINFTSSRPTPNPGSWNTVKFVGNQDESFAICFCQISYAIYGVTIKGLGEASVESSVIENCSESGIRGIGQINLIIRNNTFTSTDHGVLFEVNYDAFASGGYAISGSIVQDNKISSRKEGMYIYASGGRYSAYINDVTIKNNQILSASDGIYVYAHALFMNSSVYDLTIQNNEIFSTGYGIHVRSDANSQTSSEEYTASTYGTVIQGNIVNSTLDGICVEADAYDTAHVYDLTIQNNKISSQINGIFVYAYADWTRYEADIHHVLVGNNQISSQANGIQICAGGWSESHIHGIAVENNIVESSHYDGVYIHAEALGEADIYDVLVRNNLVSSSVNGIHIRVDIAYSMGGLSSYVYNINIQDNRVFSCSKTGLTIEPSHYVQKFAYDASVTNNVFSSMVDTGILIKWITTNTTRNYIFNNSYGIKYEGTSGNSAQFNDIYQNSLFGMTVANGATVNAENNFWGNETGPHSESVNPEGSGDIVNGNGIDLDFIPWLSSSVLSHALIPSWVRVGTQAEYSLTNPKNTSETAVWKWDIISVTADRIEVLHTFEKLWGIPDPDYPAVFKSIVDPSTGGIVNVVPMDKMLPPGYSVPFVTLFTLWVPSNMSANDSAHVIGPYGADYPPAPVLRFENVSSPLEKEECVAVGFEIEKGDPETDLWDYNVYTNSLVKFYMNWPSYEVEELVMLKQWIVTAPQPNQPPVSSFNYSPVSPVHSGSMVSFDASGSYDPEGRAISYEWNFGDGETATGRTVSYRFRGAIVDAQTHVPRTKNYIITLTVRDDKGATDTESASLTVEPLRKTINLDPGYFGVSCWMEAVYNWVGTDEATGENLYIISRIDTYSGGISGAYQLFILRRMSPPPSIPKVVWHIPLPTMPILRTYATPFTPSLWQKLWGTTCDLTTLIFPDGTFEGIGVTDTSLMLIVATGTETGITAYYDLGTVKFEPGSPVVHLKPEELKELSELKDILDLLNKIIGIIGSPGELRVYDSEGRVTGLVNGEIKEEIPGSACANGSIMILYPNQTYRYEVVGTENGTYKLLITAVENVNATTFVATEIPTLSNETHQYTIDWAALVRGEEGVTVQVDSDGDGVYEATFASDSELTASEFIPEFQAFSTFLLILVAATVTVMALRRKRAKTRRT